MDTTGIPRIIGGVEREAIDRFSFLRSGQASKTEQAEVETWRARDAANEEAWSRVSAIWEDSAAVADHPAIAAMRKAALAPRAPKRDWRPYALAASLAIVMTSTFWIGGQEFFTSGGSDASQIAEADWSARALVSTNIGEIEPVRLVDGSLVTLNSGSAMRTQLSQEARRVRLEKGEAYFQVRKDKGRPFTVFAGDIRVTALGTAFSVFKADGAVLVTLVEGSVRVEDGSDGEVKTLAPGSQLRADASGFSIIPIDARRATSWTSGMLDFDQVPLSEVVGELNRYAVRPISLLDAELGSMPVSGRFRVGDQERFVDTLVATGRVRVAERTDDRIALGVP